MKEFSVADAHIHLWDPDNLRYPWLDDIPLLNKTYLPRDYQKHSMDVNVTKIVFVQCECLPEQSMKEVSWISNLAKDDTGIKGIVPWAPMEKGEYVRDVLDKLAQNKLVKGVRRIIEFEKDMEFCLQKKFIEGVRCLSEYDFSFDINISHTQMANTIKFVKQCPDVRFILDHIGKPAIKDKKLDPWRKELKELSGMPNVFCKISGVVTEAEHDKWTKEDMVPYVYHVIECFGYDRVLFGSDWPVALLATDYARWVNTLRNIIKGCSETEEKKTFNDNAVKFYKLNE